MSSPEMSEGEIKRQFEEMVSGIETMPLLEESDRRYMEQVETLIVDLVDSAIEKGQAKVRKGKNVVNKRYVDTYIKGVAYKRPGTNDIVVNNDQYLSIFISPSISSDDNPHEIYVAQWFGSKKDREAAKPFAELTLSRNEDDEITSNEVGKVVDWRHMLQSTYKHYSGRTQ